MFRHYRTYMTLLGYNSSRATSYTRLKPMTIALQALSLVGKAEPVQVHFTLRLRNQRRSMWMQDGWMWSLHGFLHGIEWIMFHGHLDCFQKSPLGGKSNTKLGDHGTLNAHNCWFILFYHVWGSAWIGIHWNSIWLRARHIWLHTTLKGLSPHYMILEVSWDGVWTFSLGPS